MIYVGAVDGLGAEVVEALVVPALRPVRRDRHHHLPPTAAPLRPPGGIGLRSLKYMFSRVFKPLNKNIGGGGPPRIYRPQ